VPLVWRRTSSEPKAVSSDVSRRATVLDELGFGLDLSRCAVTGSRGDLAYVSPKTGRAVSRAAGSPWQDKLLALPGFLGREAGRRGSPAEIGEAFRLTGFFFGRHVYEARGIEPPEARAAFLSALGRRFADKEESAA
jgi:DNA repair protein RecO (recombination protein O)